MSAPDVDRIEFAATLDPNGGFRPEGATVVRAKLAKWSKKGRVLVTVERWRKAKTNPQLAAYFDLIVPAFAAHCGYTEREAHAELKRACFPLRKVLAKLTGEERDELPSLADASCEEMSEFMDACYLLSDRLGVGAPRPNETESWGRAL